MGLIHYQNYKIQPDQFLSLVKFLKKHEQEAPFDDFRAWAIFEVNRQAEAHRSQYITILPGKVEEYHQKKAEYRCWQTESLAQPDPIKYPIAAAESVEYQISIVEMLEMWGKRALDWSKISAKIAAMERRALLGIGTAQNEIEIIEVLINVRWPSDILD